MMLWRRWENRRSRKTRCWDRIPILILKRSRPYRKVATITSTCTRSGRTRKGSSSSSRTSLCLCWKRRNSSKRRSSMFHLLKDTFREWREDGANRLAAALAYYTTFSLAPLLVLIIAIAGLAGGREAAQTQTMAQVEDLLGAEGRDFVQGMIESASRPSTGLLATIIGAVTLLFGALGVFGELQNSLNTIWEVKPKPAKGWMDGVRRFVLKRLLSFTMVLCIGFLLLASLVISAAVSAFGEYISSRWPMADFWLNLINFIISFMVITFLFAMIFKFLPEIKIAWKDVWLGAAVTSALFS